MNKLSTEVRHEQLIREFGAIIADGGYKNVDTDQAVKEYDEKYGLKTLPMNSMLALAILNNQVCPTKVKVDKYIKPILL